ncbi:MAG TPA: hypothetical protein VK052_08145 [Zeimonas sp.]|nr:hypothetical protein [Zeimonas sp.]
MSPAKHAYLFAGTADTLGGSAEALRSTAAVANWLMHRLMRGAYE